MNDENLLKNAGMLEEDEASYFERILTSIITVHNHVPMYVQLCSVWLFLKCFASHLVIGEN